MAPDSDRKNLLYKIAKAYYEDGLTQRQIGTRFGISRVKVSRLLQQARDEKVVQITIISPQDSCADLERALEARFGLLEAVIVQPTKDDTTTIVRELGAAAADCLVRCLQGHEIVSLTWGTTLHAVIEALPVQNWPDMRVVQILGGLGQPEAEVHGTDLARRMAQSFGARLRLLVAPGIVRSKLVCDALMDDAQIAETLSLGAQADVALLGIGAPTPGSVVVRAGILSEQELTELQSLGSVGDIALRFFDREGIPIDHEINQRIIGLDLAQIKAIPRRIGVAGSADKFAVIRGALLGQLVNVLVTNDQIARRLLDEPEPTLASRGQSVRSALPDAAQSKAMDVMAATH